MSTVSVAVFSIFFGFIMMILLLIFIAVIVLQIIGLWKMFEKAGEEGWKAIIPVYNKIVLCKLVGITPWWLLIIGILYILCFMPFINIIIFLPTFASIYYFIIILAISTARSYGKHEAWAVGIIFVPWLFYPMIGFKKETKYIGIKNIKDPVWDWLVETFGINNNQNVEEANVVPENIENNYCNNCGRKLRKNAKHCPNCKKEV